MVYSHLCKVTTRAYGLSPASMLCYCLFIRLRSPAIHDRVVLLRFQPCVLSPAAAHHPRSCCAIALSTLCAESCCCLPSTIALCYYLFQLCPLSPVVAYPPRSRCAIVFSTVSARSCCCVPPTTSLFSKSVSYAVLLRFQPRVLSPAAAYHHPTALCYRASNRVW